MIFLHFEEFKYNEWSAENDVKRGEQYVVCVNRQPRDPRIMSTIFTDDSVTRPDGSAVITDGIRFNSLIVPDICATYNYDRIAERLRSQLDSFESVDLDSTDGIGAYDADRSVTSSQLHSDSGDDISDDERSMQVHGRGAPLKRHNGWLKRPGNADDEEEDRTGDVDDQIFGHREFSDGGDESFGNIEVFDTGNRVNSSVKEGFKRRDAWTYQQWEEAFSKDSKHVDGNDAQLLEKIGRQSAEFLDGYGLVFDRNNDIVHYESEEGEDDDGRRDSFPGILCALYFLV